MRIIGVIPARYLSTRFKGKVLADLNGKPMIQHVWERARRCPLLCDVIVATDSPEVVSKVKEFGGNVVLTSAHHLSGSDRVAEAVETLDVDIIVNIQGDEPLITPDAIGDLAQAVLSDPKCLMGTLIKEIESQRDLADPNVVKVVVDQQQNALYFSRAVIPFDRDNMDFSAVGYLKHLGIYAYRKYFLLKFVQLPKSPLEKIEKLEQLRVLSAGYKIKTVLTDIHTIGVDTPADLFRVSELLKNESHAD